MLSAAVSDEATAGGVGDQCGWRKKLACVSAIQRSVWAGAFGFVFVSPIIVHRSIKTKENVVTQIPKPALLFSLRECVPMCCVCTSPAFSTAVSHLAVGQSVVVVAEDLENRHLHCLSRHVSTALLCPVRCVR